MNFTTDASNSNYGRGRGRGAIASNIYIYISIDDRRDSVGIRFSGAIVASPAENRGTFLKGDDSPRRCTDSAAAFRNLARRIENTFPTFDTSYNRKDSSFLAEDGSAVSRPIDPRFISISRLAISLSLPSSKIPISTRRHIYRPCVGFNFSSLLGGSRRIFRSRIDRNLFPLSSRDSPRAANDADKNSIGNR